MRAPTKADLLDEIKRLRAQNDRLNRLVKTERADIGKLRELEVGIRNFLFTAARIQEMHAMAVALLPPGEIDLPSTKEISGLFGRGHDRVDAAIAARATAEERR